LDRITVDILLRKTTAIALKRGQNSMIAQKFLKICVIASPSIRFDENMGVTT